MRRDIVQVIKQSVRCRDYMESCGIAFNRSGFACCPFHGEKEPSLKVYDRTNSWVCFGCHKGGDVINFARLYWNIGFKQACQYVADYAKIDTGEDVQIDEDAEWGQSVMHGKAKSKQVANVERDDRKEIDYWDAYDKWLDNERVIQEKAPKSRDEDFDPDFVQALINRQIYEQDLELAEIRRIKYDGQ